jgi:hypothetical protein
MASKLAESAEHRWRAVKAPRLITLVRAASPQKDNARRPAAEAWGIPRHETRSPSKTCRPGTVRLTGLGSGYLVLSAEDG